MTGLQNPHQLVVTGPQSQQLEDGVLMQLRVAAGSKCIQNPPQKLFYPKATREREMKEKRESDSMLIFVSRLYFYTFACSSLPPLLFRFLLYVRPIPFHLCSPPFSPFHLESHLFTLLM